MNAYKLTLLMSIAMLFVPPKVYACDNLVITNVAKLMHERFGSKHITWLVSNFQQLPRIFPDTVKFFKRQSKKSGQSIVGTVTELSMNKSNSLLMSGGVLGCVFSQTDVSDFISVIARNEIGSNNPKRGSYYQS